MITIIDYGMGNLRSVANAFQVLGYDVHVSDQAGDLRKADHIVLPGVGAFGDGMANLRRLDLAGPLQEEVLEKKKPFLGICLGMQLLAQRSFENGEHEGLGWFDATVRKLNVTDEGLKLPHVGWNDVRSVGASPLFAGVSEQPVFYFVHSYHMVCRQEEMVVATCDYGARFAAAIQWENVYATQFHPEKSQKDGLQILKNFAQVSDRVTV